MTVERAELYANVPLMGRPIPINVVPFPVDDTIPGEGDIAKVVMRICLHRDGGPSEMKAEHLKIWHRAAKREENPNLGIWEKVIAIIQAAFRGG